MNYEGIDAFAGKTLKIFMEICPAFTKACLALFVNVLHNPFEPGISEQSAVGAPIRVHSCDSRAKKCKVPGAAFRVLCSGLPDSGAISSTRFRVFSVFRG